jgi:hypothetical protein
MEEQKINSKEVKMHPTDGSKQDNKEVQEKLPYDKLKEIADSLWNENRYLKQQLQGASQTLRSINRLDYLFKVAELSANTSSQWHFSSEFTSKCFEEIEKLMTLPEEEKKEEVKES